MPQYQGELRGAPVEVRVESGGLIVADAVWLYSDLRITHSEPLQFGWRGETLRVADHGILREIAVANAEAFQKLRGDTVAQPWNWVWITLASIVVALVLVWKVLIPGVAGWLAASVPVSWEEKLGEVVQKSSLAEWGECKADGPRRALEEIVKRLDRAAPSEYEFRVRIANSGEMNAFAAPGGYIVVLRGLIENADSPEQVAGVLAHEMEHVRQRHSTRGMFRQMTLSAVAGMLLGDVGALGSMAEGLASLNFQREDESSADREGMRNLAAADVDPRVMIEFFRKLQAQDVKVPAMAKYLSTHPDTGERIEELERMAGEFKVNARPFASAGEWSQLRKACAK